MRNTEEVVAAVIYTGHETKIQMNAAVTPFKSSSYLTQTMGLEMKWVVIVMLALCAVTGVIGTSAAYSVLARRTEKPVKQWSSLSLSL